jgi:ribosomal protein S18 acetylase RimI-like enzyme
MNAIEIVGAEALGDLAALEPVAEAVFGRGRRQPGWFARKLMREGVEASLSSLAISDNQVCGYVLLGGAPSLGSVARGSGVGVLESLRGRGIGRALMDHALARAHAAGREAAEFLAEPERLRWYAAQGFAVVEEQLTLLALGTGSPTASLSAGELAPARGEPLWSWTPELWERTPASDRVHVQREGARFWLTREGRAWLVHRGEPNDPAQVMRGLAALRRELAPTTPLLLYPCPAASAWLDALQETGFSLAQRSFVVRRATANAGQSAAGRRISTP